MRITKRQLRRIIKEERARLMEQPKPHLDAAASMADFIAPMIADAWWEDASADELEPGAPHPDELEVARRELENAIIKTGALRAVTDLIASVEERLRNGGITE